MLPRRRLESRLRGRGVSRKGIENFVPLSQTLQQTGRAMFVLCVELDSLNSRRIDRHFFLERSQRDSIIKNKIKEPTNIHIIKRINH